MASSRTNSNRVNVSPLCWGPETWKSLHLIAHAYPESPNDDEKQAARQFAQALGRLLPCGKCREHYRGNFEHFGQHLEDSRESFETYFRNLHNAVNRDNGKPVYTNDMYEAQIKEWKENAAPSPPSLSPETSGISGETKETVWMVGFIAAMLLLICAIIYICILSCNTHRTR